MQSAVARSDACDGASATNGAGRNSGIAELFLRHVVKDEPFRWGLLEGAKGVQLAEKGIESWRQRAWVAIDDLEADPKAD